jgi:hypothetical protein
VLESRVVVVSINRPFQEVYDYLAEPANLAQWGTNFGTEMRHVSGMTYEVDLPAGKMLMRFSERNRFGVIDFSIYPEGTEPGPPTPARVYPNGEGTDIAITMFKFPGITDDKFNSDEEWMRSDLGRMKTILEERD